MTDKVGDLEAAILDQAQQLAEQYREQAERSRNEILQEARERLHMREEHEVLMAKSLAERSYRRQVLARELELQARLDRLRAGLVRSVEDRLKEEFRALAEDDSQYLPLLREFISRGATAFEGSALVVETNARDRAKLTRVWDELQEAAAEKALELGEANLDCSGGLVLRTPDNRQRLDQTFEGRMHRLAGELQRLIQETLFPGSADHPRNTILS